MFPVPFNDAQRLEVLASYDVLDTPPEEAFDCLTRLACRQFNTPIALVSLVDEARQWFKSRHGLDAEETERELAFCAHAILHDEPLIILDATEDDRFATNALVCGDLGIRFYAGAPLITRQGFRLGTFCVIDVEARPAFTEEDAAALKDFANAAMQTLELRRQTTQVQPALQESGLADDARLDLFSMVAQEIKYPLASLFSMAQIVESRVFGPIDDPRYETFSGLISESAEQIMNVADRMLDFARLKTGEVDIKETEFSINELLTRVRRAAAPMEGDGGALVQILPLSDDALLTADRVYVIQMLTSLVATAIDHCAHEPQIQLSAEIDDTGALIFAVADVGAHADDAETEGADASTSTDEPDSEADAERTANDLSLVTRLIELHGGRLIAEGMEERTMRAFLSFPAFRVADQSDLTEMAV